MSSFIVEPEKIELIGGLLKGGYRNDSLNWFKVELNNIGWNIETGAGYQDFCNALYQMNYDAVNQRYDEQTQMTKTIYRERGRENIYRELKTVACYLYQCAEGNVPERPLYKFIEKLQGHIAYIIASNTPEYNTADGW